MYDFKKTQEFVWFVFLAALVPVLTVISTMEIDNISNWTAWFVGLGVAAGRAAAAAILARIGAP